MLIIYLNKAIVKYFILKCRFHLPKKKFDIAYKAIMSPSPPYFLADAQHSSYIIVNIIVNL